MKKFLLALLLTGLIMPSVSFASIDINLKYGSRGDAVVELQEFLISKGFLSGEASGNFFSLTQKAVIAYQKSVGLPTTGFVGLMTRTKINDELLQSGISSITTEIVEASTTTLPTQIKSTIGVQQQVQELLKQLAAIQEQFKQQKASQVQQQGSTQPAIGESVSVQNINTIPVIKNPEYEFKILSFEPIYADVDYEMPATRKLNHYKIKVQFGDKNNVVKNIDGNLKLFLNGTSFRSGARTDQPGIPFESPLFENFKQNETNLSNPFVFEYALTKLPKRLTEAKDYFLTATYKDQRYRISIGSHFNFEHIDGCDSIITDFYNDNDVKRTSSYYRDAPTEPITKYKELIKEKQCYKSLRYDELYYCVSGFMQGGYSGRCEAAKENALN